MPASSTSGLDILDWVCRPSAKATVRAGKEIASHLSASLSVGTIYSGVRLGCVTLLASEIRMSIEKEKCE